MNTYICENHRPAQAEWIKDAAEIFALRKAKMEYGRYATVGKFKFDSWSDDGLMGEFEAFICVKKIIKLGRGTFKHENYGHNVRFSVYRVTYQEEK